MVMRFLQDRFYSNNQLVPLCYHIRIQNRPEPFHGSAFGWGMERGKGEGGLGPRTLSI